MKELDGAIVGLGLTQQGVGLQRSNRQHRRGAFDAALADSGLARRDIDGYIFVGGDFEDLRFLGLDPRFSFSMQSGGSTPILAIATALGAIATGQAECVAG